jgi:3-hydroxybutyryl-CoA dehydrogenase
MTGVAVEATVEQRRLLLLLLAPMLRSAVELVRGGAATAADVDLAMRLGARHERGPLELLAALDSAEARLALDDDLPAWLTEASGVEEAAGGEAPGARAGPVGVVGSGFMASGIAYVAAAAGHDVIMLCRSSDAADRARARIARDLERAVERGRLEPAAAQAVGDRVQTDTSSGALAEVWMVVEAVSEDLAIKQEVFRSLDADLPSATLLASNTSSFRIADVAALVTTPRRVIGLHFFSPVPAMKLVEVVGTDAVPEEHLASAEAWARGIGKVPVRCADRNGFIVNSLLIPLLNDVVRVHDEGAGTVAELDSLMTEHAGHPMGPFALLDLIGLDVALAAQRTIWEAAGEDRLRPARTLMALVEAGRLGRKTGRGFHEYG